MLREITTEELADLLKSDARIRILIDEGEEDDLPFEDDEDPDDGPVRKNWNEKRASENEEKVLKAWNRGERSIKEVMEITGLSYPTVRKYLPESAMG